MINEAGIALIKSFEGFRAKAYVCPAGVLTIGYGTTMINGKPPARNQVCNEAEATKWLMEDVKTFESVVQHSVKVPLTANQYAALVSFTYNCGPANFRASTMLKMLNAGRYDQVAPQMLRWNKGGGKVLAGLTRRREAEGHLFNTP